MLGGGGMGDVIVRVGTGVPYMRSLCEVAGRSDNKVHIKNASS